MSDYEVDRLQKLDGIEHVRTRPSMYIGDTVETGLHHLIYEVVDNSIDEAVAGHGDEIVVTIQADNTIKVEDHGRGIPTGVHPETGMTGVEMVMCELFAGGKFDNEAYKTSGGLHGVGVSCVNALSEWCEVEVRREGKVHHQRYERGVPMGPLEVIGKVGGDGKGTGTTTTFKPDPEIFEVLVFQFEIVQKRLRELAYLNKGVKIVLADERDELREEYCYEGGIAAYVEYLNSNHKNDKDNGLVHDKVIHTEAESDGVWVEVALQWNKGYREQIFSFANNINTREGGTHLSGFKSSLSRTLRAYGEQEKLIKEKDKVKPEGADWREGLTAVLSVRIPDPKFEGQTKQKLGNKEVEGQVQSALNAALKDYFEVEPTIAHAIVNKGIQAAVARDRARQARDMARKSATAGGGLPTKLTDCTRKEREGTEIFLVEGDSAGGTAKSGRENEFQAILALRGKILNVEKARIDKMLAHEEVRTIIQALGTGIGEDFDLEKLRYEKIIVMCDADVDGSHIRTLLLTFFFRHMRPLVEAGHVYVAQPPLFKINKKGKSPTYVVSEHDMNEQLVETGCRGVQLHRGAEVIDGDRLKALLDVLSNIEVKARKLYRYGLPLGAIVEQWDAEESTLPRIVVREYLDGKTSNETYFLTRVESEALLEELRAAAPEDAPPVIYEGDDPFAERPGTRVDRVALKGAADLAESLARLAEFGFTPAEVTTAEGLTVKLSEDEDPQSIPNLIQLLVRVRKLAEDGKKIDLQRFKGLGEMNKEELWETTMDPEKRTLKRVAIEDEIFSDKMFTVLMGTAVSARKQFILDQAWTVEADV